jgi:hypothetical protein
VEGEGGPGATTDGMTAGEVVALNDELDRLLLEELRVADLERRPESPENWTPVEIAAHLAEFPRFFAEELERYLEDRSVVVGRGHDHEARLRAVAGASALGAQDVRRDVEESFARLAQQLRRLDDGDIAAPTENVKYGEEPLSAFLDRYVTGHKAGHLRQLRNLREAGDEARKDSSS